MRRRIWLLTTSLFFATFAWAQVQIDPCPPGQLPSSSTCAGACVQCGSIDGIVSNNNNLNLGQAPPGFCAPQLHNTQWFGFVAATPNLTLEIQPFNCNDGAGLQIGVYNTQDCSDFSLVSACLPGGVDEFNPAILDMNGLVPGGIYYIVIDGNGGDICDFSIDVTSGATGASPITDQTSINGPTQVCTGGSGNYFANQVDNAGIYEWTLNGNFIGSGNSQTIDFPGPGTYNVCVTPTNACFDGDQECITVNVGDLPLEQIQQTICEGQTFSYQGNGPFDATGVYNFSYTDGSGCNQDVELDLTVLPVAESFFTEEICQGETTPPYGGQVFGLGGDYQINLPAASGCDSVINLTVIQYPNGFEILNEAICNGEVFTAGGQQFGAAGLYQIDIQTTQGCDSTIILNLAVDNPAFRIVDTTICEGEFYDLGGVPLNISGFYESVLQTPGGCDSTIQLFLTVDSPATTIDTVVCNGDSVAIAGVNYGATGTYTQILPSYLGCDSVITLNLNVLDPIDSTIVETLCEGESYDLNGTLYNTTGVYEDTLTSSIGCDSVVILDLTVIPTVTTDLTEEICIGDSYTVGSSTYTTTGMYSDTLTAASGCDSVVNLDLQVLNTVTNNISGTICEGETFPIGGLLADTAGIWTDTLISVLGCDSVIILDLTVLPNPVTDLTVSICDGDSYVDGSIGPYSATGLYTDTLTASTGCDSIINLDLTVVPDVDTTLNIQICTGLSYSVGDSTFTQAGTYTIPLQTQVLGCDSVVTLNLTVQDVLTDTLATSICEGEDYTIPSGETYNATGVYDVSYVTAQGCDSVFTLDLTVINNDTTNLVESICDGETFTAGGTPFTTTGVYELILPDQTTGCDSVINLDLTVLDVPVTDLVESICDGETFTMGGNPFTTTGFYTDTLVAANGCDSIINLDLTVLDVPVTDLVESICDGETYTVGSSSYTTTGVYQDVLTAANGCDSIVNLDLTVLNVPVTDLVESICDGETFTVGGSSYTTTGVYQDVLTAANGCDSIVNLDLTVNPIEVTDLDIGICTGFTYDIDTLSFDSTGFYTVVLTASTGCDSIVNLTLTVTDFIETNLTESICDGDSYTLGTNTYTTAGTYSETFTAVDGCDSVVNVDLSVIPIPVTDLTESICQGDTFVLNGVDYTATGLYSDTVLASTGCDSIINLDLTVIQPLVTDLAETICEGESFAVGDSTYTQAGTYQNLFTAVSTGCDSIVNLDLTVIPIVETNLVESICDGESFPVGSSSYTASGLYQDVLTAASGCDSVVNLDLTVLPIPLTSLQESICEGDQYTVGTSIYTQSGSYSDTLTAFTGCDSIVNLDLTVIPTAQTTLDEAICDGDTYTVGNQSFDASGTYSVTLTAQSTGCDSVVTLNLTVNPIDTTDLVAAICEGEAFTIGPDDYTQTGMYTTVLQAGTGCDSIVNLDLTVYPCDLDFTLATEDVLCNGGADGQITFSMEIGTPPYTYTWQQLGGGLTGSGSLAANGLPETLDSLPAGQYQILVTDSFDVVQVIDAQVAQPDPILLSVDASNYGVFNVSCFGSADGFATVTASGGAGAFRYDWSNGQGGPTIENLSAGTYTVTVTDGNGCLDSTQLVLTEPEPVLGSLELVDPPCAGDESGAIIVEEVNGGTSPYLYTIDGGIFTGEPIFTNLAAGQYIVAVEDVNGCVFEETVTLQEPNELVLELGEDLEIELGDSVRITAQTNEGGTVESISWEPADAVDCDTCITNMVNPSTTTTYFLTLIDSSGCLARDNITVIVDRRRYIYIPNVFSPNGDGNNDFHTIFGRDDRVRRIVEYQVYDRWGETMVTLRDFAPNNPLVGWDGTHRGKPMNPGVYVYHATVEFFDGHTEFYEGDVVLLR